MTDAGTIPPRSRLRTWDLVLLYSSLTLVIALAWGYLFLLASDMSGPQDMSMSEAGVHTWDARDYVLMFAMWTIMMVGMMVPTAVRAILIYARIANAADDRGTPIASTYWFVLGYISVWTAFSVCATLLQAGLDSVSLLSPAMASASPLLGAALLVAAGLYQLTPWKEACLKHCQSPAMYLAGRFGPGVLHGIRLGLRHGAYCLGCCWLLMCLLFVGGVMNLLWIATITGFVLLEKLLPPALGITRISATIMIGVGLVFLWTGLS